MLHTASLRAADWQQTYLQEKQILEIRNLILPVLHKPDDLSRTGKIKRDVNY